MATRIYVDQENGVASAHTGSRLQSASMFCERPQVQGLRLGKVFDSSPVTRKGLTNIKVNICKAAVGGQTKQMTKPKVQCPSAKKTFFPQNQRTPSDVEYPEIEKFIPYNPLDFECFDGLEEHRLSHLCLAGVALQTMDTFDRHVNLMPSPLKRSPFTWESDILCLPFLCSLDEITIDLPPLLED